MTKLFFASKRPNDAAAIISPGNYGRGFDNYRVSRLNGGDPWMLAIDQAVELARLRIDPNLPSRFNCNYLFLSLETLHASTAKMFGIATPLAVWEAELVTPDAACHIGNFNIIPPVEGETYAQICRRAEQYWTPNTDLATQEFITSSDIRLTSRVIMPTR